MNATTPIPFFRIGTHTDRHGTKMEFSQADAEAAIAAYTPDDAPLVIGHPSLTAPAYGWVKGLRVEGDMLVADAGDIPTEFSEAVRQGRYRRVSGSWYAKGDPASPNPDVFYLKNIGFLGGAAPALKGLPVAEFTESAQGTLDVEIEFSPKSKETPVSGDVNKTKPKSDDANALEFAERERSLKEREEAFEARQKAADEAAQTARAASNLEFAEGLQKAGRIKTPAVKLIAGILDALPSGTDTATLDFAEGDTVHKLDPAAALKRLFQGATPLVEFSEVAKLADTPAKSAAPAGSMPSGFEADASRAALHAAALKLQAEDSNLSYVDAVVRADAAGAGSSTRTG